MTARAADSRLLEPLQGTALGCMRLSDDQAPALRPFVGREFRILDGITTVPVPGGTPAVSVPRASAPPPARVLYVAWDSSGVPLSLVDQVESDSGIVLAVVVFPKGGSAEGFAATLPRSDEVGRFLVPSADGAAPLGERALASDQVQRARTLAVSLWPRRCRG